MPRSDLRAPPAQGQLLQRVVERQAHLCGVPSPSEVRGNGLAPADFHAEAVEAESTRPVDFGMCLVPESVARLARATTGAERRLEWRVAARHRLRHASPFRHRAPVADRHRPAEVPAPCESSFRLRHVVATARQALLVFSRTTLRRGYDRLGHVKKGAGKRGKGKGAGGRGAGGKRARRKGALLRSTRSINCR